MFLSLSVVIALFLSLVRRNHWYTGHCWNTRHEGPDGSYKTILKSRKVLTTEKMCVTLHCGGARAYPNVQTSLGL
jgi:hypothetical protein